MPVGKEFKGKKSLKGELFMKKRVFSLVLSLGILVLLMALGGASLWADPTDQHATVIVTVKDPDAAANVTVTLAREGYSETRTTDANGVVSFTVTQIPEDSGKDYTYTLTVTRGGIVQATESLTVNHSYFNSGNGIAMTYTVNLEQQYTIIYNLDGGINASGNPTSYKKTDGPIAIGNPTREGYTFTGWTVSHGGEQTNVAPSYSIPAGTTGNIELKALWTENSQPETYTITYDLEGGTNASGNPASYQKKDVPIEIGNPTREGYIFTGWTVSHGGEQTDVAPSYSIPAGTTGNIGLKALWEEAEQPETYNITYVLDGGTNASGNPGSYSAADQFPIRIDTPTRTGYTFEGWLVTYADEGWTDITIPVRSYSIAEGTMGTITLTAVWTEGTAPTTTLAFKKLDGSNRSAPLKDVEFTLTYEDGKTYTAKSDQQGSVTFADIPIGAAALTEKTPAGYAPIEPIRVTLEEKATHRLPASYRGNILYNYAVTGDLSFIKVDASKHNAPFKGVSFTLTDRYGKTHKAVSDAKGFVRFKDIPVGRAQLTEKAPRGYMGAAPIEVALHAGKNTLPRFAYPGNVLPNHLISANLTFKKIDASRGNRAMAGVTFALTDRHGKIHIATSDHKGMVRFNNIPVGPVVLVEYTPAGYVSYAGVKFKVTGGSNKLPARDFPHNVYVNRMERTIIVPKVPVSGL